MFKDIYKYIELSKEERQKHLKLNEPCLEIGGYSSNFRGLLAYHLKTTIPLSKKIHLCHACNNSLCSNVNHLYWGTNIENRQDSIDAGVLFNNPWDNPKNKSKMKETQSKAGKKGGESNLGKTKSKEHKEKISKAMKKYHKNK